MFKFGKSSEKQLSTVNPFLAMVCGRALSYNVIDFSVIQGHRSKAEQDRYFELGRSKVQYPNSRHNSDPSEAVDLMPWVNGASSDHVAHCCLLAGLMFAAAAELGVETRWGGCWSGDPADIGRQEFDDLFHFELRR